MPSATRPKRRRRRVIGIGAAVLGVIVLLGVGVLLDVRDFDRTSGGYSPPYTDYTGEPIDWAAADQTDAGFRQSGRIIDSSLDCTTGRISFRVLRLVSVPFREVSERAIAVHKPREACTAAGFEPEF